MKFIWGPFRVGNSLLFIRRGGFIYGLPGGVGFWIQFAESFEENHWSHPDFHPVQVAAAQWLDPKSDAFIRTWFSPPHPSDPAL